MDDPWTVQRFWYTKHLWAYTVPYKYSGDCACVEGFTVVAKNLLYDIVILRSFDTSGNMSSFVGRKKNFVG